MAGAGEEKEEETTEQQLQRQRMRLPCSDALYCVGYAVCDVQCVQSVCADQSAQESHGVLICPVVICPLRSSSARWRHLRTTSVEHRFHLRSFLPPHLPSSRVSHPCEIAFHYCSSPGMEEIPSSFCSRTTPCRPLQMHSLSPRSSCGVSRRGRGRCRGAFGIRFVVRTAYRASKECNWIVTIEPRAALAHCCLCPPRPTPSHGSARPLYAFDSAVVSFTQAALDSASPSRNGDLLITDGGGAARAALDNSPTAKTKAKERGK